MEAVTLTGMLADIRALLIDGGATWDDATLTTAVRQAAAGYSLASGAPLTISGLDGALESTIDWRQSAVLVWGAAGFAALARSVDRMESFQLGSQAGDLQAWGAQRLAEFHAMLHSLFPAEPARLSGLHNAPSAPWAAWQDET